MMQKLSIRDLSLRDGQQSAFATRMTQSQMDRVLPLYRDAGFYAVEVWGGAVPDAMIRYLGENPWDRLDKSKAVLGNTTRIAAIARGRNLVGYSPYPDSVVEAFYRNVIKSGIDIMRVFDPLNDVNNLKTPIRYIRRSKAKVDGAICYAIDSHDSPVDRIKAALRGDTIHKEVYTDDYFLNKAQELVAVGVDMITIEDMSGLMTPSRTGKLIKALKEKVKVPIDFHTHCTPGYGLASVLMAIVNGVDIVDTNIWYFAGESSAPALELVYIFCKKMGIELEVNMETVAKINAELFSIRKELRAYDTVEEFPLSFDPLKDSFPSEIDRFFNDAIEAARKDREEDLLLYCHAIESYFNFPLPNETVKISQIPAGMYTNMVAQLKQMGEESLLEDALVLIPQVRMDAGFPPLVTPISQVIAAQAVSCALDKKNDRPLYSNPSIQFVDLIRGEYGKTPMEIDPVFRLKITGSQLEIPYDDASYDLLVNPLIKNKEEPTVQEERKALLLELFPTVAEQFLKDQKELKNEEIEINALTGYAE